MSASLSLTFLADTAKGFISRRGVSYGDLYDFAEDLRGWCVAEYFPDLFFGSFAGFFSGVVHAGKANNVCIHCLHLSSGLTKSIGYVVMEHYRKRRRSVRHIESFQCCRLGCRRSR